MNLLFAYGPFMSPQALIVIGLLGLLLFGNRLPSVMRSLGRSVTEFKKGVAGVEDEINEAVAKAEKSADSSENHG